MFSVRMLQFLLTYDTIDILRPVNLCRYLNKLSIKYQSYPKPKKFQASEQNINKTLVTFNH